MTDWVLAATLICGASVFTACTPDNDENPAQPDSALVQNLVGKWLYNRADGASVEAYESSVTTFVMEGSILKAYTSISLQDYGIWAYKQPTDVEFDGNKVTLTMQAGDITTVEEMTDITFSGDDMHYTSKYSILRNGKVILDEPSWKLSCTKIHDDFSQTIIGSWIGVITSDEPGFIPQPFCEEYRTDGTNTAYLLSRGQWTEDGAEYAEYFIDGNLLCTRWKYPNGEEQRENCIFMSFEDGVMIVNETYTSDGKLYTSTTTARKINAIPQLDVVNKIVGKWITSDGDAKPVATNEKLVIDFISTTKALTSASFTHNPASGTPWIDMLDTDVSISGNKVTLTNQYDQVTTTENVFNIIDINDNEFLAVLTFSMKVNGAEVLCKVYPVHYVKVNADYAASIVGKWQGQCTSQGSVYDDGQEHQWEYRADGTYVYYCKNAGGQWEPKENNLSQYFVAGNLLCTRWQNIGESENREWWEITINGDTMNWSALRRNADGSTFTATFQMTKVQ